MCSNYALLLLRHTTELYTYVIMSSVCMLDFKLTLQNAVTVLGLLASNEEENRVFLNYSPWLFVFTSCVFWTLRVLRDCLVDVPSK